MLCESRIVGPETVVLPIQNGLGSADRVASVASEKRRSRSASSAASVRPVIGPGHVHH